MTQKQSELLLKLLMLTQSDNDHEALLAVRSANKLLKSANAHWPDVVKTTTEEPISIDEYWKQHDASFASAFGVDLGPMRKAAAKSAPQRKGNFTGDLSSIDEIIEALKKAAINKPPSNMPWMPGLW